MRHRSCQSVRPWRCRPNPQTRPRAVRRELHNPKRTAGPNRASAESPNPNRRGQSYPGTQPATRDRPSCGPRYRNRLLDVSNHEHRQRPERPLWAPTMRRTIPDKQSGVSHLRGRRSVGELGAAEQKSSGILSGSQSGSASDVSRSDTRQGWATRQYRASSTRNLEICGGSPACREIRIAPSRSVLKIGIAAWS